MKFKIYPASYLLFLLAATAFVLSSCSTGKNKFEQGDYDTATLQAIKRLRSNPDNKKARRYLPLAYEHALEFHKDQVSQLSLSTDPMRFDGIVSHYEKLNGLYNQIKTCPACMKLVPSPELFQDELVAAKLSASKAHFAVGLDLLDNGDKESARRAYESFMTARTYTPEFDKIDDYIDSALVAGTVVVLIEDIPIHSRQLQLSNMFFQNSISEYAQRLNYRFVQFYSQAQLDVAGLVPDEVIVMEFDNFNLGQVTFQEKTIQLLKDSVKVGEVETSEGKKPVYGTAKAEYTEFVKTLSSSGLLDMQIVDAVSGQTLLQRKFPGTYVWRTDWATYKGMEDALTDEQIASTDRREAWPPGPQEMFVAFTQPIHDQVTNAIRRQYRHLR